MSSDLTNNEHNFFTKGFENNLDQRNNEASELCLADVARVNIERYEVRRTQPSKFQAEKPARELCIAMEDRLGHIWKQVSSTETM